MPEAREGGVDVRCCARVVPNTDALADTSLFITGNRLELETAGSGSQRVSESHTFTRVYDPHVSDKERWIS